MHRTVSSIKRHAAIAALGLLLAGLSGCGLSNPVAPVDSMSSASTFKSKKHQNRQIPKHSQGSSVLPGGSVMDEGVGEEDAPLVTE